MSADNWTVCPRCAEKHDLQSLCLKQEAYQSYGKVPPDEYQELLEKALAPSILQDTLREDYEIGIRKGVFSVSYGASCSECGFEFSFKQKDKKV